MMESGNSSRTRSSPCGWLVSDTIALAWVWSMCRNGRLACRIASTEGFGAAGSSSSRRCSITMSSSLSVGNLTMACSGSSLTAGRPAGSIVPMSQPLPFTHRTATSDPSISVNVVLTEVLPPPCSTNSGSEPRRRVV
ncbi:hypothetical protein D9M72_608260 [compost metagenome]